MMHVVILLALSLPDGGWADAGIPPGTAPAQDDGRALIATFSSVFS
jgi:hypothetical protein